VANVKIKTDKHADKFFMTGPDFDAGLANLKTLAEKP
jgi:hypothetical protein